LFICGGAFDGLEKIIEKRKGANVIGFQGDIKKKNDKSDVGIFKDAVPHDIVKFGLIPELVGRIPVMVSLDDLDKDALVRIISEPKNSLLKQYIKLFEMDGVELSFDNDALGAIAELAITRNTGARGLRSILESIMTNLMYDIPSRTDVKAVRITADCVNKVGEPIITLKD